MNIDFRSRLSRYYDLASSLKFEALLTHRMLRSAEERRRIVRCIRRRIRKRRTAREHRVADAMLLLACLPESRSTLERMTVDQMSAVAAEMRFSIFVWIDRIFDAGREFKARSRGFLETYALYVQEYLCNARANRGLSTSMAGHLMGSHWHDCNEALRVLSICAMSGRYAEGRAQAVEGLKELSKRVDPHTRRLIEVILTTIANTDGSQSVRYSALRAAY